MKTELKVLTQSSLNNIAYWWEDGVTPSLYEMPNNKTLENKNRLGWLVLCQGETIALIEAEIEGLSVYVGLVVSPEFRNKGWGKRCIKLLQDQPELRAFKTLSAGIDPNNKISIQLFESMGFIHSSTDEDGFLDYVLDNRKTSE